MITVQLRYFPKHGGPMQSEEVEMPSVLRPRDKVNLDGVFFHVDGPPVYWVKEGVARVSLLLASGSGD